MDRIGATSMVWRCIGLPQHEQRLRSYQQTDQDNSFTSQETAVHGIHKMGRKHAQNRLEFRKTDAEPSSSEERTAPVCHRQIVKARKTSDLRPATQRTVCHGINRTQTADRKRDQESGRFGRRNRVWFLWRIRRGTIQGWFVFSNS